MLRAASERRVPNSGFAALTVVRPEIRAARAQFRFRRAHGARTGERHSIGAFLRLRRPEARARPDFVVSQVPKSGCTEKSGGRTGVRDLRGGTKPDFGTPRAAPNRSSRPPGAAPNRSSRPPGAAPNPSSRPPAAAPNRISGPPARAPNRSWALPDRRPLHVLRVRRSLVPEGTRALEETPPYLPPEP